MRYNKKEIELCNEIAKYYRKPVKYGDWIYLNQEKRLVDDVWLKVDSERLSMPNQYSYEPIIIENYFPLWTWEGAREWLREKGYLIYVMAEHPDFIYLSFKIPHHIEKDYEGKKHYRFKRSSEIVTKGKTDLEAILKIVLAVLKEEK